MRDAVRLELVHEQRWTAFLPWPESLKWEGMAARGLGLLNASSGDPATASAWLGVAHTRCSRVTDRYQWVRAYVLDAMVGFALDRDDQAEARRLVDALASLASARLLAAGIDNPALAPLLDGAPARV